MYSYPSHILTKVLILTTGGEVHQKGNIAQASVLDAVTPWLKEALFQMGIHKTRTHHLGEMSEKLGQCLGKKRKPGLAITVGGASVGDADFMPRTLKSLGFLPLIQKVDLRPGKPFCLFEKNGFYVACLPGNPFAALATFRILVVPLIFRLLGASLAEPVMLTGRQESFGTVRLLKARQVLREDRTLGVEILEGNEAFKVLSLKDCDALYAEGAGFSCFWPLNPMHSYRLHSEIPFPAPLLKGSVCLGI